MKSLANLLVIAAITASCSHTISRESNSSASSKATGTIATSGSPTCDERSKQLQEIAQADQNDRKNFLSFKPQDWVNMAKQDEERRKQVAVIFAEGCLKSAADYSAAALVFQHGTHPDHYYQTFLWSQRAVELGDTNQKRMVALAIDRYLVNTNRKSLFASQSAKIKIEDKCWCLEPVEKSFPDKLRKEYTGKSYTEAIAWVKSLNADSSCQAKECARDFKPTVKGTVPGIW